MIVITMVIMIRIMMTEIRGRLLKLGLVLSGQEKDEGEGEQQEASELLIISFRFSSG